MHQTRPLAVVVAGIVGVVAIGTTASVPAAIGASSIDKGKPDQPVTRLVSRSVTGGIANNFSGHPRVSGDCSAVAFSSRASNLVSADSQRYIDAFVRDRGLHSIELVSQGLHGTRANGDSEVDAVSRTGRYVAYESDASNLVPGDGDADDVFVRDMRRQRSELVSISVGGASANGASRDADISANGRYVAFTSEATNLVRGDDNGFADLFVRDREAGTTERISVPPAGGEADGASFAPSISSHGRIVTFESLASNLTAGDTNQFVDVFWYDRRTDTLVLVTAAPAGGPLAFGGALSDMSADGSTASFWTPEDVVQGDDNSNFDVFLRDIAAGTTVLGAATDVGDFPALGASAGVLSADGNELAFDSTSSDVAAPDSDEDADVFLRDLAPGRTELISASTRGVPGNGSSSQPDISDDGRCVAFTSASSNLARHDDNDRDDIYLRRLPR